MSAAQEAHNEQTDAMTLWVAERTLRQYGLDRIAGEVLSAANEITMGHMARLNSWPLAIDMSGPGEQS